MAVEITFLYSVEDAKPFEVQEVTSEYFISLFDCDAEILKMWDLWPLFIQEYREHVGQTTTESAQQATDEELKSLQNMEAPDPETMWDDIETDWQSSKSFAPEEAKTWAERWIYFIGEWNPWEMPELFPYEMNLNTMKSTFSKDTTTTELRKVVKQAECAKQHGVEMGIKVLWG